MAIICIRKMPFAQKLGGVLFYVKHKIKTIKFSKTDVDSYDFVYVEVTKKIKKYNLGIVYRHPKQDEENDTILYNEIKAIITDYSNLRRL